MSGRQFTLRTSMAIVAALGCVLAWVRSQGSFHYALVVASHSTFAWGLAFAAAVAVGRTFGPVVRRRRLRLAAWSLLALALLASMYLGWGHHRSMYEFCSGLGRGFPYPDPAIDALERWFAARHRGPPGLFFLHGEYPTVGFYMGLVVIGLSGLAGLLAGAMSNRPRRATGSGDSSTDAPKGVTPPGRSR